MNRLSWRSQGRGSGAAGETMLRAHRWGHLGLILIGALVLALVGLVASGAAADPGHDGEELDPARNQPLPCEEVKTLGTPSRSAAGRCPRSCLRYR